MDNATNPSDLAINVPHSRAIAYASLSTTAIIAISLVFAVLICPVLQRNIRHVVIAFLVALGAGCLAGDAIFHLIPHAVNPRISARYLHVHPEPHEDSIVIWRSLVIVSSIYLFYLFHLVTHSLNVGHSHSHLDSPVNVGSRDKTNVSHGDVLNNSSSEKEDLSTTSKVSTIVIMILVGDVIHSLNDGMAIGGAFSKSPSDGLSTSLAVLFHEVPHVVGDFAILISSNLSIKKGLCFQAFALGPMYVGLLIGALLGTTLNLTDWIFAVTAGMFLFVALAEMVPELLHTASIHSDNKRSVICFQNIGLVTGFGIMALLAAFEHKIKRFLS